MTMISTTTTDETKFHQAILVSEIDRDHDIRYDVVENPPEPIFRYRRVDPYHWISPVTGTSIPMKSFDLRGFIVPPVDTPKEWALAKWDAVILRVERPFPEFKPGNCQTWCERAFKAAEASSGVYFPLGPGCGG